MIRSRGSDIIVPSVSHIMFPLGNRVAKYFSRNTLLQRMHLQLSAGGKIDIYN